MAKSKPEKLEKRAAALRDNLRKRKAVTSAKKAEKKNKKTEQDHE